jgi:hypothetical protein
VTGASVLLTEFLIEINQSRTKFVGRWSRDRTYLAASIKSENRGVEQSLRQSAELTTGPTLSRLLVGIHHCPSSWCTPQRTLSYYFSNLNHVARNSFV